jgi:hypothetical protein
MEEGENLKNAKTFIIFLYSDWYVIGIFFNFL